MTFVTESPPNPPLGIIVPFEVGTNSSGPLSPTTEILFTGGYANFFKKMIKKKVVIDQDITIKGIANAYKELI